jgi:hypothetical protein
MRRVTPLRGILDGAEDEPRLLTSAAPAGEKHDDCRHCRYRRPATHLAGGYPSIR